MSYQALSELQRAMCLPRQESWTEAPRIPESIAATLASYAEKVGQPLNLVWNGWTCTWSVMSVERRYNTRRGQYEPMPTLVYLHVDDQDQPLPLDMRLFERMAERHWGEKPWEKRDYEERQEAAEAKRRREVNSAIVEESLEEIQRDVAEINAGRSVEDVIGLVPKPRSFGAHGTCQTVIKDRRS